MSKLRRSVLYIPADNARALAKAATLPADAVIVDLEDAVAPDRKESARSATWSRRTVFPSTTQVHPQSSWSINTCI